MAVHWDSTVNSMLLPSNPNKPGVPKIDADIAYRAPNMCFNFDGEMALLVLFQVDWLTTTSEITVILSIKVMKICWRCRDWSL